MTETLGPRPIRVIFLCAAGMSSSLIKNKVESLASQQGIAVEMESIPSMMFETVDYSTGDLVLLGPQVRGQLASIRASASPYGLPVEVIGFREYGLVDAPAILQQILRLFQQHKQTLDAGG